MLFDDTQPFGHRLNFDLAFPLFFFDRKKKSRVGFFNSGNFISPFFNRKVPELVETYQVSLLVVYKTDLQ